VPRARRRRHILPTIYTPTPFTLSDANFGLILECLNLEIESQNAQEARIRIEQTISRYTQTKEIFDSLFRRPATILSELVPLLKAVRKTKKCLSEIDPSIWGIVSYAHLPPLRTGKNIGGRRRLTQADQDQNSRVNKAISDFIRSLPILITALELAENHLSDQESRGGKKTPALDVTVADLIYIFEEYYRPKSMGTNKDRELNQMDFVSTVLEDADEQGVIRTFPKNDKGILALVKRSQNLFPPPLPIVYPPET